MKGSKILLKKKKTKSNSMLVSNIEIFLKKKKKRSANMLVNDIKYRKFFSRMQETKTV